MRSHLINGPAIAGLSAFAFIVFSAIHSPAAVAAASPTGGTLSLSTPTLTFTGSLTGSDPGAITCINPANDENPAPSCEEYSLSVDLPAGFAAANPNAKIRVSVAFDDVDYDVYLYDAEFETLDDAATSDNPEVAETAAAAGAYYIDVTANLGTGGTYTATVSLIVPDQPPLDSDGDGVRDDHPDLCPSTPSGTTVDANGCPISTAPDADGDGVPDSSDLCASTPPGTSVDATGCAITVTGDASSCAAPGVTILTDPTGDTATPPTTGNDLKALKIIQPAQSPVGDRIEDQTLAFRIEIGAGAVPSPATIWFTSFQTPQGTLQGVRMSGDSSGAPVFESYFVGADNSGGTDGRFADGTKPATGTFDAAAGLITIFVKVTDIGFSQPGQKLKAFNAGYYRTAGGVVAQGADDGAPANNLSRSATAEYQLHDNTVCGGPTLKGIEGAKPATGLPPRYQIHVSPADLGNEAGEPSVGINRKTKRSMFISYTQALRTTYPEYDEVRKDVAGAKLPMSCDAKWEDKSGTLTTVNSLDPILFTDEVTGRTFNSQLSGDNSLMEYTDDDGENWSPAQAGPPNGGADHQAVATGPYPASATPPTARWPSADAPRAVYYCSQSVATAFCSRSDDGGTSFGPGMAFKNSECSAGALHGHVKVAPDGTAYVPDSSQCILPLGDSAEHVVAFVSEDAGLTWDVRDVPQSTGGDGSDPSIGIATDGTAYMCYPNADSTVHVAVSGNKGITWEGGQDIGAAEGLVQTRFPQMIAGDGDRAACAFLGTKTPGNGSSLDFKGVWYGYIATTYDRGKSWHLVNVTPGDPVQGHGGVGPDGTNRNLLDFNDLQIDEEGRVYFAFADGCIGGCVKDPSKNSFAAKATIVRQVGGRSLFSKFDAGATGGSAMPRFNAVDAIKPAEACAREDISTRSVVQSEVRWNAPDDGASPITEYKVYRSLDKNGPFTLIGTAGTERVYYDTAVKPSVDKYYYRVEAYNAVGVAALGNTIELAVSAPAADPCKLPGEIVSIDATGDAQGGDDLDIVFLGVAETADRPDDFTITMKIANFTTGSPPATSFFVMLFPSFNNLYIALNSTQGPAVFDYGHFEEDPAGQGFLLYTRDGALPNSSFLADGTIRFVVPRSMFSNPAIGAVIPGFDARARVGAASANSRDSAGNVDYTVKGIAECTAPGIVIADLTANLNKGKKPLSVTFAIGGAQSKGKKLSSYSILFGDEEGASPAPTTGSIGTTGSTTVSHTYQAVGTYRARLTVTDETGAVSTNLAEETIEVLDNLAPIASAGADITVNEGDPVDLDGRNSEEPDGDDLSYAWTQRSGTAVTIDNADEDEASFTAPTVDADTTLVFRLTVRDPEGLEHFDEVAVRVLDVPAGGGDPVPSTDPNVIGQNKVGALAPMMLGLLGLGALARRRRNIRR